MPRRKDYSTEIAAAWARVVNDCGCDDRYYCPTADGIECLRHSGFATCCNRPRRHVPVTDPPKRPVLSRSPFAVPNSNTDNLVFDDFHPLDHTLAECTGHPGGRRRHLTYWWTYLARPALHTHTLCRLGLHKSAVFRSRNNTDPHTGSRTDTDQWFIWDGCTHCHKPLSTPQPL